MNSDAPDWEWRYVILAPLTLLALNFGVLPLLWIKGVDPLTVGLVGILVSGLGTIAILTWLLCRRHHKPIASLGLRLPPRRADLITMPILGFIGAYAVLLVAQSINREIFGPEPQMQGVVSAISNVKSPLLIALWFVGATVIGPIAEEIVFRGVIYRATRHRWGVGLALGISSIIFSLVHLDPFVAIPILGLGLILGLMTELSKSIVPSILLHMAYNGIAFVLARHS